MLAAWLAALTLVSAAPQEGQGPPDADVTLEDVVVDGRTTEQQARAYVETLTATPGRSRLARWRTTVCVGVTGLDGFYSQFLIDRVSAAAASVGLEPGDPGCRPDVLIAFTREPDAVARSWVASDVDAFRPFRGGEGDLGLEALERFESSDVPVRWWHVSFAANSQSGLRITRTRAEDGLPTNSVNTSSLIQSSSREYLAKVIIIVDAGRIQDVSFGSLADYLSVISLAQFDNALSPSGFDTVLNLFSTNPGARLSAWDHNFLRSLYETDSNPEQASTQARHIARGLARRQTQQESAWRPAGD